MRFLKSYNDYLTEKLTAEVDEFVDSDTELVDDEIDLVRGDKITSINNWKVY